MDKNIALILLMSHIVAMIIGYLIGAAVTRRTWRRMFERRERIVRRNRTEIDGAEQICDICRDYGMADECKRCRDKEERT